MSWPALILFTIGGACLFAGNLVLLYEKLAK